MSKLGNRIEHERTVTNAEEKLKRMNDKAVLKALTTKRHQEKVRTYDLLQYDLLQRAADELKKVDRMMVFREGMAGYQRRVDLVKEIEAMLPNWIPG